MSIELKDKDALSKNLTHKPEVFISDIEQNYFQDSETGEWEEVEYQQYGEIRFKPSQKGLLNLFEKFKDELKKNGYIDGFKTYKYLKELYDEIHPVSNEFLDFKKTTNGIFNFRNGINIFYDHYPELNPKHIENLDILPKEALEKIQEYCLFQKNIIDEILIYLNEQIPENLDIESFDEQTNDENDTRIFIKHGSEFVKNYFSFFVKETNTREQILSDKDFGYFLSKNFQGFPKVSTKEELSFHLIDGNHLQFIVYNFYRKYSSTKEYPRFKWAELLKSTFPTKYGGRLEFIETNFKKDKYNSTQNKFEEIGLELPT